jgi:heme oxygenase (biliverdin-producing, ferredoxin)
MCFLTDSLAVYTCMETIVASRPELACFVDTGLERSGALKRDLVWITEEFRPGTPLPEVGEPGASYVSFLEGIKDDVPRFMCHYYNHYFAHTAGGMMIGRKMSKLLLEGNSLAFYQWESDVKPLMAATKEKIDAMALGWDDAQRLACMKETANCFKFGGGLNSHFRPSE